jgi:hypothetical protein
MRRLHQTDDAEPGVGAQIERVGVFGVDPAQDDVNPFQSAQRAHPQLAVAHHQVRALHQRKTQQRGQIRLVERGFGEDAGAEDHHHRILRVVGCGVDQRQPQRLGERRRRARHDPLIEFGNGVCDDATVGQRVAGARRRLRPVGVDLEGAVR